MTQTACLAVKQVAEPAGDFVVYNKARNAEGCQGQKQRIKRRHIAQIKASHRFHIPKGCDQNRYKEDRENKIPKILAFFTMGVHAPIIQQIKKTRRSGPLPYGNNPGIPIADDRNNRAQADHKPIKI